MTTNAMLPSVIPTDHPVALNPVEPEKNLPEALEFLAQRNGVDVSCAYPPHLVLYDRSERTRVLYVCRDPRLAVAFLLGLSCGREKR